MKTQPISGTKDLADLLAGLTAREENIYLQVVSRKGHLIGIGMEGGKIVHLQCGAAEGRAVLPLLGEIKSGDNVLEWPPRPNLKSPAAPDIEELYEALRSNTITIRPPAAPADKGASVAVRQRVSNQSLSEAICPLLRPYIGPMTDIICREVVGITSRSVAHSEVLKMIDALAKNLRDAKTKKKFTLEAREKIQALFD